LAIPIFHDRVHRFSVAQTWEHRQLNHGPERRRAYIFQIIPIGKPMIGHDLILTKKALYGQKTE
jgi:hypothetical protein